MAAFAGRVFERLAEGGIGRVVPNARITFTDARTHQTTTVQSRDYGAYQVELVPSQYIVRAEHPEFTQFNSDPWFFVLNSDRATADIFLYRDHPIQIPQTSLFRGRVMQHMENGNVGQPIECTLVTFINSVTSQAYTVQTDCQGAYQLELPIGHYIVTAIHPNFEPFSSEPGCFVLRPQPTTANIFLKLPQALAA